MQYIYKLIINIFKILLPGLMQVVFVLLFGLLGVFIEEEPLLMLLGGFDNLYVSISFFIISNIVVWIICFYIFKYGNLFSRRFNYLLVPIFSTLFIVLFLVIYYLILFYYQTGLLIYEVDFLLSENLEKTLATSVLIILNTSIFISLLANILIILVTRKSPKQQSDVKEAKDKDTSDTMNNTFEDSITI
ncbi:MAG TPA: hypothetical protein PLS49_06675 [Candidatus Woesebacteria bacterium]|nr:hypothetical protein [Candidatus Woesebacteria bacterium]